MTEHDLFDNRLIFGDNLLALKALKQEFAGKIDVNQADTEYDFIYVNGSHTLNDPHNKIHLIEEACQRRMFESEGFESLV